MSAKIEAPRAAERVETETVEPYGRYFSAEVVERKPANVTEAPEALDQLYSYYYYAA